ncbi:hypothetical protein MACH26_08820 [Planctobacterium marinum]|uniref:Peptidase, M23/M37 family n=1 Tax=Planctobacterium marinum TaxID=1631968 RepID=A0AA48HFD8_9ALTE|nr:hypothetical protein MACH26_08820 [Planctobacterium marinum]
MKHIHVARQHFDRLPKKHKLVLSVLVLFTLLLTLIPGEADSKNAPQADQLKLGQRVSIALPDSIANSDEASSLIVTQQMLNKQQAEQSSIEPQPVSKPELADAEQLAAKHNDKAQPEETVLEESVIEETVFDAAPLDETNLDESIVTQASVVVDAELAKLPSGFDDIPHGEALELSPGTRYVLPIDASILLDSDVSFEEEQEWQTYTVRRGDNLAKIFSRAGLTAKEVYHVSRAGSAAKKLLKIMPGENLEILKSKEGDFKELQYSYSPTEAVRVYKQSDSYKSEVQQKELYTRLNYASGEISSNFWNAGVEAGLSDNLIMSLATVFGWDIDFALDIRKGDNFNVIFEENYIEGEFVGYGDIVAAEFSNQGEEFAAIRYKDGNYYTPEGRSMRKSFLRAPVNFKYISSNFNPRRFHPVQKRYKAHNGIDYAAKTGTPVVAAGDGKVIESSYNRFNGHYVFLQHGDTYTTKYIHFSKRAVKKGQWVKQGQVIGYVGATGLAAGPHLHYEFLVNGVHKNPRTVKLPKALPIKKSEKSEFLELARDYQAKLDNNRRIMLAMN